MVAHTAVHALVRQTLEARVLDALRTQGPLSRAAIARHVGISRTTLSDITAELLQAGSIVVLDTDAAQRSGSGRPAERLALDPASGHFLGVDLGHRRAHVAVADASHEVIAHGTVTYADTSDWPERVTAVLDLVDRMTGERGLHLRALEAVAVGVPGPYTAFVSDDQAPSGGGWGTRPSLAGVDRAFAEHFGTRVLVDNNARFAALAESLHEEPGGRDLLYVRIGDGVGGGVVVGGQLVHGAAGLAGEIGHVRVVADGRPCRCGKRGCLETVASVQAIFAACRDGGADVTDLEDLRRAVEIGHPVVDRVLRDAGEAVGRVLGVVAMVLNPAEVVVGGEVALLAPALVQQAASTVRFELFPLAAAAPSIRAARVPDAGGALGAIAALVRQPPDLTAEPEAGPRRGGSVDEPADHRREAGTSTMGEVDRPHPPAGQQATEQEATG